MTKSGKITYNDLMTVWGLIFEVSLNPSKDNAIWLDS